MKILVKFEKEYDSDEFYSGLSEDELADITFEEFKVGIVMDMQDYPGDLVDLATFEIRK